jgi:ABC-2 type transport system permease protein
MSSVELTGLGRPIRGPSALGGDLRRLVHLTVTLAVMEFKLRFFGSVLGYLWQLMRPLMLFGVLYLVFTEFVRIGAGVPHYQVILLTGIVMFSFFSEATNNAVQSLVAREALLRKVRFPRMVVPLSVTLTALFNLGMNLVAVAVFCLASGIEPTVRWLELPLLVLMLTALAAGVGLLLSALFVRFRDIAPIWEVAVQALFYGSPVFYTVDMYGNFKQIMSWTPIVAVLTQMRRALIDPSAPSAADARPAATAAPAARWRRMTTPRAYAPTVSFGLETGWMMRRR